MGAINTGLKAQSSLFSAISIYPRTNTNQVERITIITAFIPFPVFPNTPEINTKTNYFFDEFLTDSRY